MARTKSKTDQVTIAAQRLLEDDEVQKQLRIAGLRLREAWSQAAGRPAAKAAQDKKVYMKVREAAASLADASARLRKKPPPPKHRGRKLVAGAAIAGGAAYAVKKKRGMNGKVGTTAATDQPVAAPTPPLAVT
jgi:hypothetical protein